ncbi:MAG TPA: response regulator [Planctomycetia bacterium]|nr:response regulator [Planctomycetia bacterium]
MSPATVFVIDDNQEHRNSLRFLLEAHKYKVEVFPSAESFFAVYDAERAGCVLIDLRLENGIDGLELWKRLQTRGYGIPGVLISGAAKVREVREAFHSGMLDFLEKPFDSPALLACVDRCLTTDRERRAEDAAIGAAKAVLDRLSDREREVADCWADGLRTKETADRLNVSARTIEHHIARIKRRLEIDSAAEFVQLLVRAGQRPHGAELVRASN